MRSQTGAQRLQLKAPLPGQAIADQAHRLLDAETKGLLPGHVGHGTIRAETLADHDHVHGWLMASGRSARAKDPSVGRGSRSNLKPGAASMPITTMARVCQRKLWRIASAR